MISPAAFLWLIFAVFIAIVIASIVASERNRQRYIRRLEENPWPTLLEIWEESPQVSGRYAWLKDMHADERVLYNGGFVAFRYLEDPYPNSKYKDGPASFLIVTEKGRQKLIELVASGTLKEEDLEPIIGRNLELDSLAEVIRRRSARRYRIENRD